MVAAIIPAYNEAATVGAVIDVVRSSPLVREVVVVDDGSTDGTAEEAVARGAKVLRVEQRGKGQALAEGVAAVEDEVLLFLDGDLIGLRPDHVDRLVTGVTERGAGMTCGLFDRGPALNRLFLRVLPVLTGERVLRRQLFESLAPEDIRGYKIEAALNARAAEAGLRVERFVCDGMWHRTKEEKFGNPVEGFLRKVAMLAVAMESYVSFWIRRRVRRWREDRARRRAA